MTAKSREEEGFKYFFAPGPRLLPQRWCPNRRDVYLQTLRGDFTGGGGLSCRGPLSGQACGALFMERSGMSACVKPTRLGRNV